MSRFNLSNTHVATFDMGQFIPTRCQEVLPGDKIVGATTSVIRMMPQLAPFFTRLKVCIFHFFVPTRLIWEDWEDFITGGPTNDPADEPEMPYALVPNAQPTVGSLLDYLGVPVNMGSGEPDVKKISVLPVRACRKIWNDWGRDQDLQPEAAMSMASGQDSTTALLAINNLAWYKDLFTACRPWAQKGPAVTMPLGTRAPIEVDTAITNVPWTVKQVNGTNQNNAALGSDAVGFLEDENAAGTLLKLDPNHTIYTDLANATAVEVNALRRALAYQRFAENRARYGSRYTEYLRAMGVVSPDERIQRSELLSRGEQTMQTSEVLQTGQTNADPDGVGTMYGHTVGVARSNAFKRYFPEHGFVVTFICVRPDAQYHQGLHKMWSREHKEDFWQPELQHIGSQPIYRRELYALGNAGDDATIFGYNDPYDHYRYMPSYVTGKFRPGQNLSQWTLSRDFSGAPILNDEFVTCTPSKRVFPVTTEPVLWVKSAHRFNAQRLIIPVGTSLTL